jgi:hypothetical protein
LRRRWKAWRFLLNAPNIIQDGFNTVCHRVNVSLVRISADASHAYSPRGSPSRSLSQMVATYSSRRQSISRRSRQRRKTCCLSTRHHNKSSSHNTPCMASIGTRSRQRGWASCALSGLI